MCEAKHAGRMPLRIVLVGHCGPDAAALRSAILSTLPDAVVERANDLSALEVLASDADLLLINRVLEGTFERTSGLDLVRRFSGACGSGEGGGAGRRPRLMLVSNHEEWQREAVQAGACPGFGKRDLSTPRMAQALLGALGLPAAGDAAIAADA